MLPPVYSSQITPERFGLVVTFVFSSSKDLFITSCSSIEVLPVMRRISDVVTNLNAYSPAASFPRRLDRRWFLSVKPFKACQIRIDDMHCLVDCGFNEWLHREKAHIEVGIAVG